MEDHKMHEPEEDQNGNIISIQGGRLRRIVFLNGFNRGEIETIFFFLLRNEFARLALSATIVRGHGCRSTSTVVNSLREDASHGGGSLLPSLARADTRSSLSLSLSLCLSSLAAASRAGELMRGCRLDADNAGGVSFVQSSMILCSSLSSPPFSSPLLRSFSRLLAYLLIVLPSPRLLPPLPPPPPSSIRFPFLLAARE